MTNASSPVSAQRQANGVIRFVSVGQLIHLKGFDISLRAFALANIAGAEYWLIGDGRERRRLEELAYVGDCRPGAVLGEGAAPRGAERLRDCDVMLHPALHNSGGWAAVEGMAAGLPVICLDLGGPATQVTAESGFKIPARDPDQASRDIAAAMIELARDEDLRRRLSRGARERVRQEFCWTSKAERFNSIYQRGIDGQDKQTVSPVDHFVPEKAFDASKFRS